MLSVFPNHRSLEECRWTFSVTHNTLEQFVCGKWLWSINVSLPTVIVLHPFYLQLFKAWLELECRVSDIPTSRFKMCPKTFRASRVNSLVLVWWRVLRPEWSYTAGLLSLLGEPSNAADHGATVCLGIASPKPWAPAPLRSDCNIKIRRKTANLYNNPQM